MSDIFLSYTEKDRETVGRLAETFRSAGWSVWWDQRIPAGGNWRTLLDEELQAMRCMVVVWSTQSIGSRWVRDEASEGLELGRLVPVKIEPVKQPPGFREIQCADLVGWDGTATWPGMKKLIEDIGAVIDKPAVAGERVAVATPAAAARARAREAATRPVFEMNITSSPPLPSRRQFTTFGVGLIVLVAAVLFYFGEPRWSGEAARVDGTATQPARPQAGSSAGTPVDGSTRSTDGLADTTGAPMGDGPAAATRKPATRQARTDSLSPRCQSLLQKQSVGDPLTASEADFIGKACRG